jgi:hypothetical protein
MRNDAGRCNWGSILFLVGGHKIFNYISWHRDFFGTPAQRAEHQAVNNDAIPSSEAIIMTSIGHMVQVEAAFGNGELISWGS